LGELRVILADDGDVVDLRKHGDLLAGPMRPSRAAYG
jgi:hypothetical protein